MKEKIIRATAKIISANGIANASTRAICAAAGITAPTLYYYFRDKEVLINEVTHTAFERHLTERRAATLEGSALEKIKLSWDDYMNFVVNEPDLYSMILAFAAQGRIHELGYQCFSELVKDFEELHKDNRLYHSPLESARIFIAAAQGASIMIISHKYSAEARATTQKMRDLVTAGLIKLQ